MSFCDMNTFVRVESFKGKRLIPTNHWWKALWWNMSKHEKSKDIPIRRWGNFRSSWLMYVAISVHLAEVQRTAPAEINWAYYFLGLSKWFTNMILYKFRVSSFLATCPGHLNLPFTCMMILRQWQYQETHNLRSSDVGRIFRVHYFPRFMFLPQIRRPHFTAIHINCKIIVRIRLYFIRGMGAVK
jgi:hypothetical protein